LDISSALLDLRIETSLYLRIRNCAHLNRVIDEEVLPLDLLVDLASDIVSCHADGFSEGYL